MSVLTVIQSVSDNSGEDVYHLYYDDDQNKSGKPGAYSWFNDDSIIDIDDLPF